MLNLRKGYETADMRDEDIAKTLPSFDAQAEAELAVVDNASDPLDVPTFDPAQFT